MTGLFRLGRESRGSVLVEFAVVVPLMVLLFFGVYEGTRAVRARMNVTSGAEAYANMIAMRGALTAAQLAIYCDGAKLAMYPFDASSFKAAVSSVTKNAVGTVAEDWHDATCGSAAAISSPASVATSPTNMIPNSGDSVIIVRVTYTYASPIHVVLPGSMTFTQTVFARPRNNASITCITCT